jgi:amino-acid N-acetyltransferase
VHQSYRDAAPGDGELGIGSALLEAAGRRAREAGATRLFVLTTQTRDWFVDRGFVDAAIDELPTPKQAMYNYQRNARVMIRDLG